jgi:hypothetical protein
MFLDIAVDSSFRTPITQLLVKDENIFTKEFNKLETKIEEFQRLLWVSKWIEIMSCSTLSICILNSKIFYLKKQKNEQRNKRWTIHRKETKCGHLLLKIFRGTINDA